MTAYINSLISVIIVCEIVLRIAPDGGSGKKYVRIVCSLAVLLTMISPIRSLAGNAAVTEEKIADLFSPGRQTDESDAFAPAASAIGAYIEKNHPAAGKDYSLTFVTGENGELSEVQIFLGTADGRLCAALENDLGRELGVTVRVFGGG